MNDVAEEMSCVRPLHRLDALKEIDGYAMSELMQTHSQLPHPMGPPMSNTADCAHARRFPQSDTLGGNVTCANIVCSAAPNMINRNVSIEAGSQEGHEKTP